MPASAPPFKLLRYFTSASLLAFVLVATFLAAIFRTIAVDDLLKSRESALVTQAQVIANELWQQSIEPVILASSDKAAVALQGGAPPVAELHQRVLAMLKGTDIFKIKVYNLQGMTVYSTDPRQIGEDKSANAGVQSALQGRASSLLVHRDQFSAFEGELQNRDLIESYVPRYNPLSGKVSGVFEIYSDATADLAAVNRSQWIMVSAVAGLMLLLYGALFLIVKRAQNLLIQQDQEREQAQQALTSSEERWKFALEGSDAGVWDRNLTTGEVVYSKRYREVYGYTEDEAIPNQGDWYARVHPDDLPQVEAERQAYLSGQSQTYASERRMQCKDGSWKWILSRGMVVARDAQGQPTRMIGTHTDISARKAAEEQIRQLAHFDLLTGLPNRALFSDRLQQALAHARRDQTRLALLFIDLDKFKPVNDAYGHQVGDLLLSAVGQRLSDCVPRESDTVGRVGGDEFVVMLPEIESMPRALTIAEKIRRALDQPFDVAGHGLHISSSIGVAMFPEHGKDEENLLARADAAMYRAKESGRNRIEVAPDGAAEALAGGPSPQ